MSAEWCPPASDARDLLPVAEALTVAARHAGSIGSPRLAAGVRRVLGPAESVLRRHVDAMGARYACGGSGPGAEPAVRLLALQHDWLRIGLGRLEVDLDTVGRTEPTHRQLDDLSARLWDLAAVLRSHIEQEREFLLAPAAVEEMATGVPSAGRARREGYWDVGGRSAEPPARVRTVRSQHREIEHILQGIETIGTLAPALNDAGLASSLRSLLDASTAALLPHFAWEERVLYPRVDAMAGGAHAARLLRLQHAEVRGAIERVEADWLSLCHGLRRLELGDPRARLHGLRALLEAHVQQEEAILLPILMASEDGILKRRRAPTTTSGSATCRGARGPPRPRGIPTRRARRSRRAARSRMRGHRAPRVRPCTRR